MYNFWRDKIIIIDTEYTSWDWTLERDWSWENEYKELVQIAGILVDTKHFNTLDNFSAFIQPKINSKLSDYFINLTKITQEEIDTKWDIFENIMESFYNWSKWNIFYSFWNDWKVIFENYDLYNIKNPFNINNFFDARDIFESFWIDAKNFNSWTIHKAVWIPSNETGHNALWDAKNVVNSLKKLYYNS